MPLPAALLGAVRSEIAKLPRRSSTITVALAIVVPVVINLAIAEAAARNTINGAGGMQTNNAAYWVLIFSTFILIAGPVFATAGEFGNGTIDAVLARQPRRWLLPCAKALVFGVIGALASGLAVLLLLTAMPRLYPEIWGTVDLASGEGLRLLISIPCYLLLISVLGVGLATLVPKPGLILMLVLLWRFGVESFFTFVSGDLGLLLQHYSPFRNAELGVGQMSTFDSPFGGPIGSLLYFAVLCAVVFGAGLVRITRADITR